LEDWQGLQDGRVRDGRWEARGIATEKSLLRKKHFGGQVGSLAFGRAFGREVGEREAGR
jgi:hypothetical protein